MTTLEKLLKKAADDERIGFLMALGQLCDDISFSLLIVTIIVTMVVLICSLNYPPNYVEAVLVIIYGFRATSNELSRRVRSKIFQQNKK